MRFAISLLICLILASCDTNTTPRKRGFPKVEYPERNYSVFESKDCPMRFEIPTYAKFSQKKTFFNQATENNCWFNLEFPEFEGTLHFSYKELTKAYNSLDALVEDAHKLIYKHSQKATAISPQQLISTKNKVQGIFYEVRGDAASSTQFFLTDTEKHFLRASLYLKTQINSDSLQPIINYLREDIDHIIETFEWKE